MFYKGTMELRTQNYEHYLKNTQYYSRFGKAQNKQAQSKEAQNKQAEIQLNTRISKPAKALSFGGLFDTGFKLVEFVNENEAAYNAIYSLFVAGILKPVAVMNMPGSEEKDKQMIATKNFLQAFLGSFLGLTVGGGFVKKIIDNIDNNLKLLTIDKKTGTMGVLAETSKEALKIAENILKKEKNSFANKIKTGFAQAQNAKGFSKFSSFFNVLNHGVKYEPSVDEILQKSKSITRNFKENHLQIFAKQPEFSKMLKDNVLLKGAETEMLDSYKTFWKNSTGGGTAIMKAMIASALLPPVLKLIFGKKNKQKEEEKLNNQNILNTSKTFLNEKSTLYKSFNNKVNFTGNTLDGAINLSTLALEKASVSKTGQFFPKALSAAKKPSARMGDIESVLITLYWIQNTIRSKKIDPEQKFGFCLHTGLVTLVSSTAAFILDAALDPVILWRKNVYANKIKSIANKTQELYPELIKKDGNLFKQISNTKAMDNVELAQYAITREINKILSNPDFMKSLEQNKDETIANIVSKLNNIEIIKNNNPVDKALVDKAIENLSVSKELQKNISTLIQKEFGTIFNVKGIVKELSNMFLSNVQSIKENPEILIKTVNNLTKNYDKKMSKFKSLTIFTLVVRFLVPVVMVPFTGNLKKKLVELTSRKKAQKA